MQVKRFLNNVPVNSLQGSMLHDAVIEEIIAGVRARTDESVSD